MSGGETAIGFEALAAEEQPVPLAVIGAPQSGNNDESGRDGDSEKTPLHENKGEQKQTLFLNDGKRRIDFVLAYQIYEDETEEWREKRERKRKRFFGRLETEGLELEEDRDSFDKKTIFVKIHAPWTFLARVAEQLFIKMPVEENNYVRHSWWDRTSEKLNCCSVRSPMCHGLEPVQEYITLPFNKGHPEKFLNIDDQDNFFSPALRSRMVQHALVRTSYSNDNTKVGYERLIGNKSLDAAYPLHEGRRDVPEEEPQNARSELRNVWGRFGAWYKFQPLDHIRAYFGEKIGLYFCWLGFYTQALIPISLIGLLVFFIGLGGFRNNPPANEICNTTRSNPDPLSDGFLMCPLCSGSCDFYELGESCYYARAAYLFDNRATVAFAFIMCLWAVFFLEFWKRKEIALAYRWDVLGYEDTEQQPRAAFEAVATEKRENPVTGRLEGYIPPSTTYAKITQGIVIMIFMVCVVIAAVLAIIIYRVAIIATASKNSTVRPYSSILSSLTAAVLQLIAIAILDRIYQRIAEFLTNWENHRTQTEFEDNFTFKMFLFQFVNYYSSVFYIAFFKGKFNGYPGNYHTPFGFRMEECGTGGCMIELTIQLAIIMVGKQVLNNAMELFFPFFKAWWRRRDTKDEDLTDNKGVSRWEEDLDLADLNQYGLFAEYLEMIIQFGFITIFVSAFPLAPLFALLNNILEIRLDAYKFVTLLRRPVSQRAQDIGIWYSILDGVTKFAVFTNAFIIAVTSDFIPRELYMYTKGNAPEKLDGFVNDSLLPFPVSADTVGSSTIVNSAYLETRNVTWNATTDSFTKADDPSFTGFMCRFKTYRELNEAGEYQLTRFYFQYLTAALAFVIVFEHLVLLISAFVAWLIPDVPSHLKCQIEREQFLGRQALRERELNEATALQDKRRKEDSV
ncbi:anoctamin-4-like isoform X2 [Oscarella lobularis]|uniref:anoctamin-4-like isoform X2 n=1 Tax=Oscarella lobularis TaxID=121494 RepID=UPI0033132485